MISIFESPFKLTSLQDELAYKFIKEFSRFEFALKRAGYCKQQGNKLIVEWWRFAEYNSKKYNPIPGEISYLVDNPPLRQMKINGALDWQPIENRPSTITLKWLLTAVYTVRNNLFHGGKWTTKSEVSRDESLILAARFAIALALNADADVLNYYKDPI